MSATDIVRRYLALVEAFSDEPSAFEALLHPEFEQLELPNALNPRGQRSDRADCLRRMALGRTLLTDQHYAVESVTAEGERVVVEASWTGTLAITAGQLVAGQVMKAAICMVFELHDGRIRRQRNYDCFEPWAS